MELIKRFTDQMSPSTPEWQKQIFFDKCYTKVVVDFCKVNNISSLDHLILSRKGRLFCSVVKLLPCPEIYNKQEVHLECASFKSVGLDVVFRVTVKKVTGDTLKSRLHYGGEFAIVALLERKAGKQLLFHPLIIGLPHMMDMDTGNLTWNLYNDYYNVYIENFDEFSRVRDYKLSSNFSEMKHIKEKTFKSALGRILSESTPKDWGGETSDFFTSHLHLRGRRLRGAFLLKGPSKFSPMTMKHLGANGDQIVRLSKEPADVLIVQHCHDITPSVIETLKAFATQPSNPRYYCLVDGRESLRVLEAFSLKEWALSQSSAESRHKP
ncbi:Methyltransferase [Sulfidibacter corallicola]